MDLQLLSAQLKKINGEIPFINQGGCGKFAFYLGERLEKENIKFKFVLVSYCKYKETVLSSARKFVQYINTVEEDNPVNRNNNDFDIVHILIYYKGKFIDSQGVHSNLSQAGLGDNFRLSAIVPKETLKVWNENGGWNSLFCDSYLPKIQSKINSIKLN